MKRIPLTRGREALVSDKDYKYLIQWKWFCMAVGYAVRNKRKSDNIDGSVILMHRVIFHRAKGYMPFCVDHRNCNPLDNRRKNLRSATQSQNMAHRGLDKIILLDLKVYALISEPRSGLPI